MVSAYAPHSGYDYEVRKSFFGELSRVFYRCKCHAPTFLLGDLNSRLYSRYEGESAFIGHYVFENGQAGDNPLLNRNLLLEVCAEHALVIANTFFEKAAENLVTYRGWGVPRFAEITRYDFAQLDHILAKEADMNYIKDVFTDRSATLNSHHFLMTAVLDVEIPKLESNPKS